MSKSKKDHVSVIGAGGHAKVVISALQESGYTVEGVFDDDPRKKGTEVLGVRVEGPLSQLLDKKGTKCIIAIGDNGIRKDLASRFDKTEWVTVVHPNAYVHSSVELGPGTVVFAGAVIQPDTRVGAHVIVSTGATVDHDCAIDDFAHVAPGGNLAGEVHVGKGAFLGVGAKAVPGVRIGEWSTIGAGSVVVNDVSDNVTAVGIPAKPTR